jgi:hypothetical protein
MNKMAPITLIWLAVLLSILSLLTKLDFFADGYDRVLLTVTGIAFIAAAVFSWVSFVRVSRRITNQIQNWDTELQRDIPSFIKKRRLRMITLFGMMILLYVIAFLAQFNNNQVMQESLLYVLIIGSFHCALVTTLVMFKMVRTLSWVKLENQIAKTEDA